MPKKAAITASRLDWDRELCKIGCKEWVPWYRSRNGNQVNGCRIGVIPEKRDGQWYCRQRKATKKNGRKER